MKRVVSSFMLAVLLLAAIQPTLAFHFCGGSLSSVGIGEEIKSCCDEMADVESTACAEDLEGNMPVLSEPVKSCCSNYSVEFSTDMYQIPFTTTSFVDLKPDFYPAICLLHVFFNRSSFALLLLQNLFPPGDTETYTNNLQILNCVFRI